MSAMMPHKASLGRRLWIIIKRLLGFIVFVAVILGVIGLFQTDEGTCVINRHWICHCGANPFVSCYHIFCSLVLDTCFKTFADNHVLDNRCSWDSHFLFCASPSWSKDDS